VTGRPPPCRQRAVTSLKQSAPVKQADHCASRNDTTYD
jgi:hypothetical protein